MRRKELSLTAKLRRVKEHDYPWPEDPDPNVKGGVLTLLWHFKPLKERPKLVILDFEKPLVDFQKKIVDVRKMANETGLDLRIRLLRWRISIRRYRKALCMMYYADHHGFPIVTFIDTPGAYADLKSEELGQGEAIAHNLRTMFGLKVPIVSIIIGEGGSGGALAIGCANKLLILENAVFYVPSPEACAVILWKAAKASPKVYIVS